MGDVEFSSWRERGSVRLQGADHRVFRESALRGAFVLEGGRVRVRAVKPSAFRSTFEISYGSNHYVLRTRSALRKDRVLYEEDALIGGVFCEGSLNRRARVELPDDLPMLLTMFVVWLTLLQWRSE